MNVTDEILLEDSDDDFVPSQLVRRRSSTRRRSSVERFGVGHADDEIIKSKSKGSSQVTIDSNGGKGVKDVFKNALKEKLTAAARSTNKSVTPPVKRKLSEGWKQAQAKLTPMTKSNKKFSTIDDDYDFKDDPPKNKVAKLSRSFNKSTLNESARSHRSEEADSSVISLDDEEDDLEVELAKIDKLKQSLDRQSEKPIKKTPSIKKTTSAVTPQPVRINFSNNSSVKKTPSLNSKLQRATPTIANKPKTVKKEKVVCLPKVIETGPIDIFDDLIIKTTKGHPCNFCDKNLVFKKRREMIDHLQLEHEEELTNPQKDRELAGVFSCDTCEASFHSKHILRTHAKAHKKLTANPKCDNYYRYYLNIRVF